MVAVCCDVHKPYLFPTKTGVSLTDSANTICREHTTRVDHICSHTGTNQHTHTHTHKHTCVTCT